MTNLKTPEELSAEMFQRAMKAFNDEYDSHPINGEAEKAFLKAEADRQEHLENMFLDIEFDMPVGTLVRIDLGDSDSKIRKEWVLGLQRPDGLEEGECLLYTGWFRRDVNVSNEYVRERCWYMGQALEVKTSVEWIVEDKTRIIDPELGLVVFWNDARIQEIVGKHEVGLEDIWFL